VRVVVDSARILRWLRPGNDVLMRVNQGTPLEVLDQDGDWYWVVVPRNAHGTRKAGWIHAINVEPFTPPPVTLKPDPRSEPAALSSAVPAAKPVAPPAAEDKVTITAERGSTAPGAGSDAAKRYTFDDVYFERNRATLRPESADALRAAVDALKSDASLVVDIQGYTCNLGTSEYNLALGTRRAQAVRDYLLSQGVPAERLTTISLGETHPKANNATEESRRLNRRVALVPKTDR
jgi:outer membrane protein OmpA-like peptidoglycan-associated protein